jgi:hypothetical protein
MFETAESVDMPLVQASNFRIGNKKESIRGCGAPMPLVVLALIALPVIGLDRRLPEGLSHWLPGAVTITLGQGL